jgi:multidrug efflux pump subunit AcrA (membrane-fusion protein)
VHVDTLHVGRTPLARIGLLVVGAVVLSAGSWFLGMTAAGRNASQRSLVVPEASLLTAVVQHQVVVSSLHGRATIGFADLTSVRGPATGGRVTATPLVAGDPVDEGSVLIEVDGRPTFALRGTVPMYRALVVGTEGADVQALEEALSRLGLDPGPVDGEFDAATEDAVRELFRAAGYQPVEPSAEQRAAYSSAVDAATKAELAVLEAESDLRLDEQGLDPGERAALEQAVSVADQQVAKAQRDAAVLTAQVLADIAAAQRAVASSDEQVQHLDAQLGLVADPPAADIERAALQASRSQARGVADQAAATLDTLVREAPAQQADAQADIAQAETAAQVARLALDDALRSKERELLVQRLAVARDGLVAANARVADQAAIVGAGLQASELVFFPTLPRSVQALAATVGGDASGELMEVAGGELVGRWFVTDAERQELAVGGPVQMTDSISASRIDGTIAEIATSPGDPDGDAAPAGGGGEAGRPSTSSGTTGTATADSTDDAGAANADEYLVTIAIPRGDSAPPDGQLIDRDVLVSAPVSASERGLAVPVAALTSRPDGTTVVRKDVGAADAVVVPVQVGARGGGFVRVDSRAVGALAAGDRVVVGRA